MRLRLLLGVWLLSATLGSAANRAIAQYNVFTKPNTAPLSCFDIRVTNLYNYKAGGNNFVSHVLPVRAGFTPTVGLQINNGASGFLRGYVYNASLFAGGDSLIEIGLNRPDSNHPENAGRLRIELPPNLEFVEGADSRDITLDIDYDHPFRNHVRLVPNVNCGAANEAAKNVQAPSTSIQVPPAQLPPAVNSPVTTCNVTSSSIDRYLASKQSPLTGQGSVFMEKGKSYDIDPRFLVALTGIETSFGTKLTPGDDNNAFNWFYNGPKIPSPFDSWESGIQSVASHISKSDKWDLTNTATIYRGSSGKRTFCGKDDPRCPGGLTALNEILTSPGLKGQINSLHFPSECKKGDK